VSLGFSNDTLPLGSHVCFYYSSEDVVRQSLAFLRVGLDDPADFCVIFADKSRFDSLTGWLQDGYPGDVAVQVKAGKLALIGGSPTLEGLVSDIGATLDAAVKDRGYQRIRFLGFIGWGLPDWPDEDSLLEFESTVNEVVTAYPAVIICTYGVPKLPGTSLIYGGLQTHALTTFDGRLIERNPFYVPPDVYLERLPKKRG
jgi:MEDS: MEthanogen/methylotroph, DcmR Sensory domain